MCRQLSISCIQLLTLLQGTFQKQPAISSALLTKHVMGCHLNVLVAGIQLVRQIAHILFFDQFEGIVYLHEYVHEIE